MIPKYEENRDNLQIVLKIMKHSPPHLHNALEIIYVTEGSLEYGIAEELYHMEKGDLAFAFPEVIHHCQVFDSQRVRAIILKVLPSQAGQFQEQMQLLCPQKPVLEAAEVHPDIRRALSELLKNKERPRMIEQIYLQLILAQALPHMVLVEKNSIGSNDMVYRTVSYIARHFQESVSLDRMARDLGVSKYVLSRVFSGTFHSNFNKYLNEQRLNYAVQELENTNTSITDICLDAGFQSQRTFNRAFQERYKMSPKEYRTIYRERLSS